MKMNGDNQYLTERQNLLTRLLDSVKQCQVRFGGRAELATDSDSRVCCLCAAWEAALQHGMRHGHKTLSALKQVSEITGLAKVTGVFGDIKNIETEPVYWQYVKEYLNKHEIQRFMLLKSINTDSGRGRAWLRSSFNEHSLERYTHMLLENETILSQYYDDWAFLRDQERSSMLPMMSAGLGSILFAINIDKSELNTIRQPPVNVSAGVAGAGRMNQEPAPVIAGESVVERRKERKKKKKAANIVNFGEDEDGAYSSSPASLVSPALSATDFYTSQHFTFNEEDTPTPSTSGMTGLPTHRPAMSPTDGHTNKQGVSSTTVSTEFSEENNAEINIQVQTIPKHRDIEMNTLNNTQLDMYVDNSRVKNNINSCDQNNTTSAVNENRLQTGLSEIDTAVSMVTKVSSSPLPLELSPSWQQDSSSILSRSPRFAEPDHQSINSGRSMDKTLSSQDSISSADVDMQTNGEADEVLTPVSPTGLVLDGTQLLVDRNRTRTTSVDSGDLPSYSSEDVEQAAVALAMAQKVISSPNEAIQINGPFIAAEKGDTDNNVSDLRQAVVAMMVRKDEMEEQNRKLAAMFEQEMDVSSTLRASIEELKLVHASKSEKDHAKLQALQKENELLKHQLKKYVSAVQMLRNKENLQGEDTLDVQIDAPQPTIPPAKDNIDYGHEAAEYEKKLIQVAEMHGELMEFNEMLHRQLNFKDRIIKQLEKDLVDLRGPDGPSWRLPDVDNGSISDASEFDGLNLGGRTLINIWIPSAFLRGTSSHTHHVYQVYVRVRDEEWNVYRRYSQFRGLLTDLKKKYPIINSFKFPPKKAIGYKDATVVEKRRKTFESFLRHVINYFIQNTDMANSACKETLCALLPFFKDQSDEEIGKRKSKQKRRSIANPQNTAVDESLGPSTPEYTGL